MVNLVKGELIYMTRASDKEKSVSPTGVPARCLGGHGFDSCWGLINEHIFKKKLCNSVSIFFFLCNIDAMIR